MDKKGNFTPQKIVLKDAGKKNIKRGKILNVEYSEIVLLEKIDFIRTAVKRSVPSLF